MNDPPRRPLFADLRDEIRALGAELREMAAARRELARLELQAALDGCAGIPRYGWLLIFAGGLLILALSGGYLAWRRFWRRFTGLRETMEELREDMLW